MNWIAALVAFVKGATSFFNWLTEAERLKEAKKASENEGKANELDRIKNSVDAGNKPLDSGVLDSDPNNRDNRA